jgi:hypothetical protein
MVREEPGSAVVPPTVGESLQDWLTCMGLVHLLPVLIQEEFTEVAHLHELETPADWTVAFGSKLPGEVVCDVCGPDMRMAGRALLKLSKAVLASHTRVVHQGLLGCAAVDATCTVSSLCIHVSLG